MLFSIFFLKSFLHSFYAFSVILNFTYFFPFFLLFVPYHFASLPPSQLFFFSSWFFISFPFPFLYPSISLSSRSLASISRAQSGHSLVSPRFLLLPGAHPKRTGCSREAFIVSQRDIRGKIFTTLSPQSRQMLVIFLRYRLKRMGFKTLRKLRFPMEISRFFEKMIEPDYRIFKFGSSGRKRVENRVENGRNGVFSQFFVRFRKPPILSTSPTVEYFSLYYCDNLAFALVKRDIRVVTYVRDRERE